MKYDKDYWLYVEPYCFINITHNPLQSIIYNTINNSHIISSNKKIVEICKNLSKPDNLMVIRIKQDDLLNENVKEFINKIRYNFIGDIIGVDDSKGRPIQLSNQNYISQDLKTPKKNKLDEFLNKKHLLLKKLGTLNIYLNNKNSFIKNSKTYQFDCLINEDGNYQELEIEDLSKLLIKTNIQQLNILGGSIFAYSKLKELLKILTISIFNKTIFFNSMDILNNKKQLSEILNQNININIDISYNEISTFFVKENIDSLSNNSNLINFRFIIENENELEHIESTIVMYNIKKYSFIPFYNGNNESFFNQCVYYDQQQLLEQNIESDTIIENVSFNANFYGKLIVTSNFDCYSNLNLNSLGNLKNTDISDLIYKEIKNKNIWELTRRDISPCKNCIFNILCPPISDYEISLNKYNLCKIYNQE